MADRPATEPTDIEIMPEMIEAGRDALDSYNCEFEMPWEAAIRIYRTMEEVRRRFTHK